MFKKLFVALVIGMSTISISGCGMGLDLLLLPVAPIMQLGIFWYQGEATKYYNNEAPEVYAALKDVLEELEMPIISDEIKGGVYHITAGDGDNDKFNIKIDGVRKHVAKLSIRVNFMGDKPYAELIYRMVDKRSGIKVFHKVNDLRKAMHYDKNQKLR